MIYTSEIPARKIAEFLALAFFFFWLPLPHLEITYVYALDLYHFYLTTNYFMLKFETKILSRFEQFCHSALNYPEV